MNTFFGIPAHPLLVHIPTVLLPLAALGVVLMVIKPAWHLRYRWAVLALSFVGAIGAVLAADAGENLGARITAQQGPESRSLWRDHADAGDTARLFGVIFFVVVAAYILIPWFVERRRTQQREITVPAFVRPALMVLVLAASAGTVITIVQAGHSGAKAVWCGVTTPPSCGQ